MLWRSARRTIVWNLNNDQYSIDYGRVKKNLSVVHVHLRNLRKYVFAAKEETREDGRWLEQVTSFLNQERVIG